jgi:hypothetical protein
MYVMGLTPEAVFIIAPILNFDFQMEAIPKEYLTLPERRKELHKEVDLARRNLAQQVNISHTFTSEWRMKLCLRNAPENHIKRRIRRGQEADAGGMGLGRQKVSNNDIRVYGNAIVEPIHIYNNIYKYMH